MDASVLLKFVGLLKWPLEWLLEWQAISVEQRTEGLTPPNLVLTFLNRSKNLPLHVHEVRFCIGLPKAGYSWAIRAAPYESVTITPKNKTQFRFPMTDQVIVSRTYLSKSPPPLEHVTIDPPYRQQLDFMRAMIRAPRKQVWLEVDYNEHERRVFMRGKIQNLMPTIMAKIDADIERAIATAAEKGTSLKKNAILLLPTGSAVSLEDFELNLGELISCAQEALNDLSICPESFGVTKHFFFVNSSTGSLIDSNLDLRRPLSSLSIDEGNVIELRFREPRPLPDGRILNPMRGVVNFVK